MKKITAFLLSFLVICSCFAACKEEEKANTFLAGGIWEAVLKSSDTEGQIIAYKFKEDRTFLFYQSLRQSLVITAGGYYEHDENKEKLVLTNADQSQKIEISCKYNKDDGILTLDGPLFSPSNDDQQDVKLNFAKVPKEDEKYYREDATMSYNIKKQTTQQ